MHSLQELHRETLQTFKATFIVQCWIYEGKKGKQGIMFCLRPGLTSEWSVFKKLCILLYAVVCCMRVYLRRVLAVAEKKSLQLPQY